MRTEKSGLLSFKPGKGAVRLAPKEKFSVKIPVLKKVECMGIYFAPIKARWKWVSHLQMCILHFERLTKCVCGRGFRGVKHTMCRRCFIIAKAKEELKLAGIKWVRGVESDAVGEAVDIDARKPRTN